MRGRGSLDLGLAGLEPQVNWLMLAIRLDLCFSNSD